MSSTYARNVKFLKYIRKNKIYKLHKFIVDNIEHLLDEFSHEFECILYSNKFSTTLLYYLFSVDNYELSSFILSKDFNVYKGD